MTEEDAITLLKRAVSATGRLVAGVGADQWTAPTPCPGFDVRALVQHLMSGLAQSADVARGEPFETAGVSSRAAHGSTATYAGLCQGAVTAWASPGALDRQYVTPWGRLDGHVLVGFLLIEALGHGWDLAQATGQRPSFDDDLVTAVWERAQMYEGPEMRTPGLFGPAIEVAADAPLLDRLAGFLGRRPTTNTETAGGGQSVCPSSTSLTDDGWPRSPGRPYPADESWSWSLPGSLPGRW